MPALCQTGSWESPPGAAPCSLTPHGQLVHGQPFPNWDPQTRLSTHFQVHPQLRVACPAGFQRTCSVLPGGPNGSRRRTPAPGRPAPLSGGAGKLAGAAPPAASAALRRGVCRQGQQPAASSTSTATVASPWKTVSPRPSEEPALGTSANSKAYNHEIKQVGTFKLQL